MSAETTVTISGNAKETLEVKRDVRELKAVIHNQKKIIDSLTEKFHQNIERVEREFNERLNAYCEDRESWIEQQKRMRR
jgi:hypothetical protein